MAESDKRAQASKYDLLEPGGAVRQRMVRVVTAYERRATRWCVSKALRARRNPAARSLDSDAVSVRPCRRLWQLLAKRVSSIAGSPSFASSDYHWTKEYHQGPSFDGDIAIHRLAVTMVLESPESAI
jgi:hypothetical protein